MKTTWQKWVQDNINTTSILALLFFLFTFFIFRLILLKEVKATSEVEISIVECVKGALFLILGFYFGSSMGSKKKQEQLDKKEDEPKP